jgi:hypothetical protein
VVEAIEWRKVCDREVGFKKRLSAFFFHSQVLHLELAEVSNQKASITHNPLSLLVDHDGLSNEACVGRNVGNLEGGSSTILDACSVAILDA